MTLRGIFCLDELPVAITGAAGLLGRCHAFAVAESGGVPLLLDIDAKALKQLSTDLADAGFSSHSWVLDTTDEKNVRDVAAEAYGLIGPIYGIVNNVAANPKMKKVGASFGRLESLSVDSWDSEHDISLKSAFLVTKYFGAQMVERGSGSIVNIASDLAVIAPDHRIYSSGVYRENSPRKPLSYVSSKAAVLGISRYFATYWAPLPIRSNALIPGSVESDQDVSLKHELEKRIPLNRLALPNEYQGGLIFLLSAASSYMTGAELLMDGGRSAW